MRLVNWWVNGCVFVAASMKCWRGRGEGARMNADLCACVCVCVCVCMRSVIIAHSMGLFLQGQWEGVAPVVGTFLVFLRNFSKGLRNVAVCERERLTDHDAFV